MPDTPTPTKAKRDRSRSGHSQTVQLRSGGSITLTGTFNLFSMSVEDVQFVSDLGAKMRAYTDSQPAKQAASVPIRTETDRGLPKSTPQATGLPKTN